jgi:hypothetical protein
LQAFISSPFTLLGISRASPLDVQNRPHVRHHINHVALLRHDGEYVLVRERRLVKRFSRDEQLSELFKKAGASGSTMVRGISFFLATAKAAGFKISSTIQAPTLPRAPRSKTAKKPIALAQAEKAAAEGDGDDSDDSGDDSGVMRFEIPIPVDRRVRITIPADFNSADWTLLQTMFTAYVTRWQAMEGQKDKGPTPVKE